MKISRSQDPKISSSPLEPQHEKRRRARGQSRYDPFQKPNSVLSVEPSIQLHEIDSDPQLPSWAPCTNKNPNPTFDGVGIKQYNCMGADAQGHDKSAVSDLSSVNKGNSANHLKFSISDE